MSDIVRLPDGRDAAPEGRFINRELSWLAFNARVLQETENTRHPLLERLRFLAISATNLNEFFMVRVAGLKGQVAAGVTTPSQDGLTPAQQLDAIHREAVALITKQQRAWHELRAEMQAAGVTVAESEDLDDDARAWLDAWFLEQVFPVLTPFAVDATHPFPFIPNTGLCLAVEMIRPADGR